MISRREKKKKKKLGILFLLELDLSLRRFLLFTVTEKKGVGVTHVVLKESLNHSVFMFPCSDLIWVFCTVSKGK